jgi:lysophospholipase L1-like esterase
MKAGRTISRRCALLMLGACFVATTAVAADPVKRILIVGDSWAASITAENRDGFPSPDVFDDALKANGLGAYETQGKVTAWGGRKASDWAKPENLAQIRGELEAYPSIDMVHLIIGGNDYLSAVNKPEFPALTAEDRAALWDGVVRNIQTIVDTCLAVRDTIRVVIADYDYLDAKAAEAFWKMNFHGASARDLNTWFVELGEKKKTLAERTDRCAYVNNWGTLQYWFGTPPRSVSLPGGNIDAPMPPGISPDGIHPNAEAHAKLLQNAIDQCYKPWLTAP